jgi:hypothetical protein
MPLFAPVTKLIFRGVSVMAKAHHGRPHRTTIVSVASDTLAVWTG